MKKVLLAAIAASVMTSCTEQMVTRYGGGTSEIKLGKGQKLVEVTWKDEDGGYTWKDIINTGEKEDFLDACYEMVCWLKENGKI